MWKAVIKARSPVVRSAVLAGFFWAAIFASPFWAAPLHEAMGRELVNFTLMGVAILFQTDALNGWQHARSRTAQDPDHRGIFLITGLGGGLVLTPVLIQPEEWAIILLPLGIVLGLGVLMPGLRARFLKPDGDERYRQNQLRAREAGLRALTVLGAAMIWLDLSGLVALTAVQGVMLVMWGVGTTVTGMMWWLESRDDETGAEVGPDP